MCPFSIGVSTLQTGTRLVDVAADNIANANTPGYHAKEATLVPVEGPRVGGLRIGLGVSVEDVDRIYDELIERSVLTHVPLEAMFDQEADVLAHMEMLFSEPSEGGLDAQMGEFFNSAAQLAAMPSDPTLREQLLQKARALCATFNQLAEGLESIRQGLVDAAQSLVSEVNDLTGRIADLNGRILQAVGAGVSAPDLMDLRDQLVTELADYIDVSVYRDSNGMINVSSSGTLLVSGNDHTTLEVAEEDGRIFLVRPGGIGIPIRARSGRIAGVFDMANDVLPELKAALDDLANSLRRAVNSVHTTAIPSQGRFESLQGINAFATSDPFYDTGYGVVQGTAETLYVNVEDQATGEVTRYELTLDTTTDADQFLIDLSNAINDPVSGIEHLTATIGEDKLNLSADSGYTFGFATPYDPNPAQPGDITSANPTVPAILDTYTGETDLKYDITFLDGGQIGADDITIQIQVGEPAGPVLRTVTQTIGADYMPGTAISLENGLKLTLAEGDVNAGDGFSFVANASNDTAGVLDALGLNTFFTGLGAGGIAVAPRLLDDTSNLAGSIRSVDGDNHRFLDLADLVDRDVADGGTMTLAESYRSLLSELAITRTTTETQLENQEQILRDLENRRDSVSGVSVDEEMVNILQARTIYQGGLKYRCSMSWPDLYRGRRCESRRTCSIGTLLIPCLGASSGSMT
jgi:flagellar hook-associated protein 1 FlgK